MMNDICEAGLINDYDPCDIASDDRMALEFDMRDLRDATNALDKHLNSPGFRSSLTTDEKGDIKKVITKLLELTI